jgi:hypothetical protein
MRRDMSYRTDDMIAKETDNIDWHAVSEAEGASFGLALGIHRDALHVYEKRYVAWGTVVGGVISMAVLSLVALLAGAGPAFALKLVIVTQVVRALWLLWKTYHCGKDVLGLGQQAIDFAHELAQRHPLKL